MPESKYANVYTGGAVTATAFPTVPVMIAGDIAAVLAALNASATVASAIDLTQEGPDRPLRASLGVTMNGSENNTADERIYLARRCRLEGGASPTPAMEMELIGSVVWTCGPTALATNVGAHTSHKSAKGAAVTASGLMAARANRAPLAVNQDPAKVELFDVGDADYIVRVLKATSVTNVRPMHRLWR